MSKTDKVQMSFGSSRVQSNLLMQNCFVRDVSKKVDLSGTNNYVDFFISLDEVTTPNGVELRESKIDYPITPDYVKSFADSADYHKDVFGAINNGCERVNLGDVSYLQKVSGMDDSVALSLYRQLQERFKSSDPPVSDPPVSDPPVSDPPV